MQRGWKAREQAARIRNQSQGCATPEVRAQRAGVLEKAKAASRRQLEAYDEAIEEAPEKDGEELAADAMKVMESEDGDAKPQEHRAHVSGTERTKDAAKAATEQRKAKAEGKSTGKVKPAEKAGPTEAVETPDAPEGAPEPTQDSEGALQEDE